MAAHSSAIGRQFAVSRSASLARSPAHGAYAYASAAARGDCARPPHPTRGQAGSTSSARSGAVRTAPTDAARRQRTHLSLGPDFHQTQCGCARPKRSRIGRKHFPALSPRRAYAFRAQTACAPARRTACRASRSAAACGSGSQAEPAPRRFAWHACASCAGPSYQPRRSAAAECSGAWATDLPWTAPSRATRGCPAGTRSGRPPRRPHAPRRRAAPHASHVAPSGHGTRRRAAAARSAAPPRQ
jgi:hypothetical protein